MRVAGGGRGLRERRETTGDRNGSFTQTAGCDSDGQCRRQMIQPRHQVMRVSITADVGVTSLLR